MVEDGGIGGGEVHLRDGTGRLLGVSSVDRFADATLAYQGYGRGLPLDQVRMINEWAVGDTWPDLVILLTVPPEVTARRMAKRIVDLLVGLAVGQLQGVAPVPGRAQLPLGQRGEVRRPDHRALVAAGQDPGLHRPGPPAGFPPRGTLPDDANRGSTRRRPPAAPVSPGAERPAP